MRQKLLDILICPNCYSALELVNPEFGGEEILIGSLRCNSCLQNYPIVKGIPRFVTHDENYCKNFGWQWQIFRRAQIDRFSGTGESYKRFFGETEWYEKELKGLLVLDAGCGAGRFTDIACQYGAHVVAVDISEAVDACAETVKDQGYDIDIIQASIYKLPFKYEVFDKIFCLGVIQHTPDPKEAMVVLPGFLKPGGKIAYWIYEIRWTRFLCSRYYMRFVTRWLPLKINYLLSLSLVIMFFPITLLLSFLPGVNKIILPTMPIAARHYWGRLTIRQQFEWTLLDTFDWYAPRYEICQKEGDLIDVLRNVGMIKVHRTKARGMSIVAEKPF